MICSNCGTENAADALSCASCGCSLTEGSRPVGYLDCVLLNGTPYSIPLRHTNIVGRANYNDIVINDPAVSRQHACLVVTADGLTVADLGSTNGVFVNSQRIDRARVVGDGDLLKFGDTILRIRMAEGRENGNGYQGVVSGSDATSETALSGVAGKAGGSDSEGPTVADARPRLGLWDAAAARGRSR